MAQSRALLAFVQSPCSCGTHLYGATIPEVYIYTTGLPELIENCSLLRVDITTRIRKEVRKVDGRLIRIYSLRNMACV